VLTNLMATRATLGISDQPERVAKWKDILAKLPEYRVNADGALAEWADEKYPDRYAHRHLMHLYPLWGSGEFSPEKTPKLWDAAKVAFEKRMGEWYHSPDPKMDTSSHGRMQLALCAARLGEGDVAWEILTKMAVGGSIYPSMVSAHYANGRTFNVDANGAIPEILNECLLRSEVGRLDLLPALPSKLPTGEIRGLAARGQITVQRMAWSPENVELTLLSPVAQVVDVGVVGGARQMAQLAADTPSTLKFARPK